MALSDRDRQLGMDRPITRRDFMNGVALTVGGAALGSLAPHAAFGATPSGDPAKLTGMRGHSETAMSVMHSVRDGTFWDSAPAPTATGETYDLVVVGGGISGLSAALLYRQQKPDAKILILENNEEFGGHATPQRVHRLERQAHHRLRRQPVAPDPELLLAARQPGDGRHRHRARKVRDYYDMDWWDRLNVAGDGQLLRRDVFGVDALVVAGEDTAWIAETPLNDKAKADLVRITDAARRLPRRARPAKRS